jgi:hypothetical protein
VAVGTELLASGSNKKFTTVKLTLFLPAKIASLNSRMLLFNSVGIQLGTYLSR